MPCKSLLAVPLVTALVPFVITSVAPYACSSPTPPGAPVAWARPGPGVPMPRANCTAGPANAAPEPPPLPEPEQPQTHTLTIYNGDKVLQQTFVWCGGSWRSCGEPNGYDVFFRDGPCSPWHLYGTYHALRRAEDVACSLRAGGHLASVRHHCA